MQKEEDKMISDNSPSENYMCRQMEKEWTIKRTGECDGKHLTVAGRGWRSSSAAEPAGLACSKALGSTGMVVGRLIFKWYTQLS